VQEPTELTGVPALLHRLRRYFFLVLALVFGGFMAAFMVLMNASLDLTPFSLRLFTVLLGDFPSDGLQVSDGAGRRWVSNASGESEAIRR
jgi:hypothetical protein